MELELLELELLELLERPPAPPVPLVPPLLLLLLLRRAGLRRRCAVGLARPLRPDGPLGAAAAPSPRA